MKILVVTGTRRGVSGKQLEELKREVLDCDLLIHGDAEGVDRQARDIARGAGIQDVCVPANWTYYGHEAGSRRNTAMAEVANGFRQAAHDVHFAAFPDAESKGTWDAVNKLKAANVGGWVHK